MRFEFATATRILFGSGVVTEVPAAAAVLGRRALVVTGSDVRRSAPLADQLRSRGVETLVFSTRSEPTVEMAQAGVEHARKAGCDLVIGLGGGSALDAGKAIAALLTNEGDPLDYLEVVGRGQALTRPPVPYIAIPTTAGTGTEVTRNAVLASPDHRVKASLRSPLMIPRLAVVDPELTHSLPPDITASTGLDALTQLIEPFVSRNANALTDLLCREGLRRASRSLRRACAAGSDASAREDMALASLFGGLALANAKLGAVHGLAAVLGGFLSAPHGAICARLLPYVTAANVRALRDRAADSPALDRYAQVAQVVTGRDDATLAAGIQWIHCLCADLNAPPLRRHGLIPADIPQMVSEAQKTSSTKGNPVALSDAEMAEVLQEAL